MNNCILVRPYVKQGGELVLAPFTAIECLCVCYCREPVGCKALLNPLTGQRTRLKKQTDPCAVTLRAHYHQILKSCGLPFYELEPGRELPSHSCITVGERDLDVLHEFHFNELVDELGELYRAAYRAAP